MSVHAAVPWPGWRSLLFVPADNGDLARKAAGHGADAFILDLEDAVAPAGKADARAALPERMSLLADRADVLVRVNAGIVDLVHDLAACTRPGLAAVLVPKAENAERLAVVDEVLAELESAAGMPVGEVGVIALVETAKGLLNAPALAAAPRVMALALGPEDLALDLGGVPDRDLLLEPARRVAWAARAANSVAVGFPGAISNFSDLPRLAEDMAAAHRLGFAGALCIHPQQVEVCHRAFAVTAAEADWAQRASEAYAAAERKGNGVGTVDGQMVDRPVARRAQAILNRWRTQNV